VLRSFARDRQNEKCALSWSLLGVARELTFDHKREFAELTRLLNDEKMASDQDFFVGPDGIEPSASALSGKGSHHS
jgi:hypothetical protein